MTYQSPKLIKAIQLIFNIGFVAVIIISVIYKALQTLPDDWLFFLTSDAVENALSGFIATALVFFVFKLRSDWQRLFWVLVFVFLLFGLAGLKDFRIQSDASFSDAFKYFKALLGQTLLFYLMLYVVQHLDVFNRQQKIERELMLAKEQLLREQLHPHFLFNALNSLYSLSLKKNADISEYIMKLSNMMRYLTDDMERDQVPLSRELDFINAYISIEHMRFGTSANIKFTTEGDTHDGQWIAPFLLITLVENAFKHGFYTNDHNAFVTISLHLKSNVLLFKVENSLFAKQHFQQSDRIGKGLINMRKRLNLVYPKTSQLDLNTSEKTYSAYLKLTLKT